MPSGSIKLEAESKDSLQNIAESLITINDHLSEEDLISVADLIKNRPALIPHIKSELDRIGDGEVGLGDMYGIYKRSKDVFKIGVDDSTAVN